MEITKNKVLTKEERINEIIRRLDKEGKVIAGINDSIFKSLFMEEESKGVLAYIISEILHLNRDYVLNNLSFKPTELAKENYFEHGKITDLLVEVGGRIINLEMNYELTKGVQIKNNIYHHKLSGMQIIKGDEYINTKMVVQINFDYINKFDNEDDRIVIGFRLRDDENRYTLDENFINYHINMEKVREKYYNKEKLTRLEKIIMLLQLDIKEELRELAQNDKELMSMEKKIEEMSYNPNLICVYDKEEMDKMVHDIDVADAEEKGIEKGIEQGSKQEKMEIAKNMLEENTDIDFICKVTNLSKEEVENLK